MNTTNIMIEKTIMKKISYHELKAIQKEGKNFTHLYVDEETFSQLDTGIKNTEIKYIKLYAQFNHTIIRYKIKELTYICESVMGNHIFIVTFEKCEKE